MKRIVFFLSLVLTIGLNAQTVEELIAKGDSLTEKAFDDKAALEVYKQAEKMNADNWELQWRLSRAYSNIAAHMPGDDEDKQLGVYETALEHANKAIDLAPDKSVPYLRRAIVNGRIALFKGVFSVGGIVSSVRDDLEKALKLNNGSTYDMALAHYVLGRTHAKVSQKWKPARSLLGLGWADLDTALTHYEKAVKMYDGYIMFYLDYAKALVRDDEEDRAKDMLKKLLTFKIQEQDDKDRIAEAKELLNELE